MSGAVPMMGKCQTLPLAVGVSAVILFGVAAGLRHESPERPPPRGPAVALQPVSRPGLATGRAERGSDRPQDVPAPTSERVGVDPEVEQIYRQYRVALSTHDRAVEDVLYPLLLARREAALGAARRDAAEASSPEDREWAERAVRFLSDPPSPPEVRRPRRAP